MRSDSGRGRAPSVGTDVSIGTPVKVGSETPTSVAGYSPTVNRNDTAMTPLPDEYSGANLAHARQRHVKQALSVEAALLFWRGLNHTYRRFTMFSAHALAAIGFGALLGVLFFQLDDVDSDDLRSRSSAIFLSMVVLSLAGLASAWGTTTERVLAKREIRTSHYRIFTYVAVHSVLSFLILRFIPICLFSAIFLPMSELQTWSWSTWVSAMRIVLFIGGLTTFWGTFVALVSFALSCTLKRGIKIAAVVFITLYGPLVSGFLIPKDDLPTPVQYLHYASPFSVTFETLMISEFSGVGVSKEVTDAFLDDEPTRDDSFHAMGLDEANLTIDTSIAVGMYAVILAVAFIGVWFRSRQTNASFWRRCFK